MRKLFFTLALLCFLSLAQSTSAQVILTDQEAMELGHELSIAKASINSCYQTINDSERRLMTAQERLAELSKISQEQEQNLQKQKTQLDIANKSLQMLNDEHKKEISRLNKQRNIAYSIAAFFVVVAIRK